MSATLCATLWGRELVGRSEGHHERKPRLPMAAAWCEIPFGLLPVSVGPCGG